MPTPCNSCLNPPAEQQVCRRSLQRHLPIPERLHRARNHVIGQPIYQAAHVGFSLKPRRDSGASSLPKCHVRGSPDVSARFGGCEPATVRASLAHSVGIFFSAVMSPSPEVLLAPFLFQLPHTVSVGSKAPPAVSVVPSPDISRGKYSVAPGVSARHKLTDDNVTAAGSDLRAVFEKYESRANSVNCPEHLADESAPLSADPGSASCDANILAREARMDAIHSSRPFGWIEQPNVSLVHVQPWEPSVCRSQS